MKQTGELPEPIPEADDDAYAWRVNKRLVPLVLRVGRLHTAHRFLATVPRVDALKRLGTTPDG